MIPDDDAAHPRRPAPEGPAPGGPASDAAARDPTRDAERAAIWKRGGLMLFFLVVFGLGQSLLALIAFFQFASLLITRAANRPLAEFGRSFAVWLAEVSAFLTCATETAPFPWKRWPSGE